MAERLSGLDPAMCQASPKASAWRLVAQALLPNRDGLNDVPAGIFAGTPNPWWRQASKLPDARRRVLATAWRELDEGCRRAEIEPAKPLLSRRAGIFGESLVLWDHLDFKHRAGPWNRQFDGMAASAGGAPKPSNFENPAGPFVLSKSMGTVQCDLADIECIVNSKSSALHFDSVDAFGLYFNDHKRVSIDEEGLRILLAHKDIQLVHSPEHALLELSAWDPRLTACNDGGSHHLAAAQMVARRIGKSVPLRGRLSVQWLNEPAWTWMLATFWVVHVHCKRQFWHCRDIALMAGACYTLPLPSSVSQGELILIPKHVQASEAVVSLLDGAGCPEVSSDLWGLLQTQRDLVTRCQPQMLRHFEIAASADLAVKP